MAGRLYQIVEYVKSKSYFKSLMLCRLNLKMRMNVEEFTLTTADDPLLEKKLIQAAKEVLNTEEIDVPGLGVLK